MRKTFLASFFMFSFGLGCVVSSMAPRLVVPPVRAGTNPVKWEYHCFEKLRSVDIQKVANSLGTEGWEMAGSVGSASEAGRDHIWCFKRALP